MEKYALMIDWLFITDLVQLHNTNTNAYITNLD